MSRSSPRYFPAGATIEITAKTVGSRFLLRPSEALNAAILAVIGRALALFPIDLHAFAFMSNHWHALLTAPDADAVQRFVQHVHSNVARAVNRLHDWSGPVFRKAAWIVVAPDAMEERLEYILAQGTKEGLVASPREWPGAHCAKALCGEETLVATWRDRSREARLRRPAHPAEVETKYVIELQPLPCWKHLPADERQKRARAMCERISVAASAERQRPLGVDRVLAIHPHARPEEVAPSKERQVKKYAPPIHTRDEDSRSAFYMGLTLFESAFFDARDALRQRRPATVPESCFPPRPAFTRRRCVYFEDRRAQIRGSLAAELSSSLQFRTSS